MSSGRKFHKRLCDIVNLIGHSDGVFFFYIVNILYQIIDGNAKIVSYLLPYFHTGIIFAGFIP